MKAKVEVDVKGRKSVVDACTEPCAIEKVCGSWGQNGKAQLSTI